MEGPLAKQKTQHLQLGFSDLMPFNLWLDCFEYNNLVNRAKCAVAYESGCWDDWIFYHNVWGWTTGITTERSFALTDNLKRAVCEQRIMAKEVVEHHLSVTNPPAGGLPTSRKALRRWQRAHTQFRSPLQRGHFTFAEPLETQSVTTELLPLEEVDYDIEVVDLAPLSD